MNTSGRYAPHILLALTAVFSAHAHQHNDSFLPENTKKIPVGAKLEGGLTFTEFHRVINKIEKVYGPIVTRRGARLVIQRKWDNPTVNAGTYREDENNNWYVNLYGGFARHPAITADGFALVVCHEIGHHVGGAPKKDPNYGNPAWSSTEGQSDYFATLKCLRKVFRHEDNFSVIKKIKVPEIVRRKCDISFPVPWESALCQRTTVAGLSVVNVMSETLDLPYASLEKEDDFVTAYTLNRHPAPQCRLDTYFSGSICQVSSHRALSQINPAKGTCDITTGFTIGTRPLCWYKP